VSYNTSYQFLGDPPHRVLYTSYRVSNTDAHKGVKLEYIIM